MCGIYATNLPYNNEDISSKLRSIEFRGPDNQGYQFIDGVFLGHLRLSIIDLDIRSNQPFHFLKYWIVFNGEIYNFQEIKKQLSLLGHNFVTASDTEVLIKAYHEWGEGVLSKLNGMFSFVIFDIEREEIFCARDRLGVKPFYYFWKDGNFEICSQLTPLINYKHKISEEAISIYLDCGYIPGTRSIFENIYKLPSGNYMVINLRKKTKQIHEYWNLKPPIINNCSYEEAKEQLHNLMIDAVKIRLQSDVPLGTFLSGGVDSALVSSIAARLTNRPINTFTIGFNDPKYDESRVAREFAKIIGSNHTEIFFSPKDALNMLPTLIKSYDEPFADSSALPSLLLSQITKRNVSVALSGDGGDESFFGYHHFSQLQTFERILLIPLWLRNIVSNFNWKLLYKNNSISAIRARIISRNVRDFIWHSFTGFDSIQQRRNVSWRSEYDSSMFWSEQSLQQMADLNIKLWLEGDSNVKVDRASMAFSLEVRSPFLDYRIIELARSLPIGYRYNKKGRKAILKDILAEYIPRSVFNQPKKGFSVPIADWIKKDLKQDITEILDDAFLKTIPNLDIGKFKNKMGNHFRGRQDASFDIWKLYILALWYNNFIRI